MSVLDPQIEKKYEILAKMGSGGMGDVYKVRHRLLQSIRVIKTSKFGESEKERARFLREAARGTELNHRCLARVFDFDVTERGTAYIVMEYVDGVTLSHLRDTSTLPVSRVVEIALDALEGLQYLHDNGFIHRDISPDNLMIANKTHQVKLIDLGIAKSQQDNSRSLTEDGKFIGKVRYAAPEHIRGDPEPRSDLYSLGMVMYELLTGTLPHPSIDNMAIVYRYASGEPLKSFDETDTNGRVPLRLREVVMRALEREPIRRFESAKDFAGALRESQKPEKPVEKTVPVDVPKPPAPKPADEIAWFTARAADTRKALDEFIGQFSSSSFVMAAQKRRQELVEIEERDYAEALDKDTAKAWTGFLGKHPDSRYVQEIEARIAEIEAEETAWNTADRAGTSDAWRGYLRTWPESPRAGEAKQRLDMAQTRENKAREAAEEEERKRLAEEQKRQAEQRAWSAATAANSVAGWDAFIELHPNSPRVAEAKERLDRARVTEARDAALAARTIDALDAFLQQFPRSQYEEEVLTVRDVLLQKEFARRIEDARAAALRAGTIDALDKFLKQFPRSGYETEIRAALQAKAQEERDWKAAKGREQLEQFIGAHPQSVHVAEARQRIAEEKQAEEARQRRGEELARQIREARDAALTARTIEALNAFLEQFPRSEYESEIRAALRTREKEERDWKKARTRKQLEEFIATYPQSEHVAEARQRIADEQQAEEARQRRADELARQVREARDAALAADTIDALTAFLNEFPRSEYEVEVHVALQAAKARQRAEAREAALRDDTARQAKQKEERAWNNATTGRQLELFIAEHPQSAHVPEARRRIEKLQALAEEKERAARLQEAQKAKAREESLQRRRKALQSFKETATRYRTRALAIAVGSVVIGTMIWMLTHTKPATLPISTSMAVTQTTTTTAPPPPTITETTGTVAPPPPPMQTGQLFINASPWGEIRSVKDDKNAEHVTGDTLYTPATLTLPVGRYVVQLWNPKSNKSDQCTVDVASGGAPAQCIRTLESFDTNDYFKRIAASQ